MKYLTSAQQRFIEGYAKALQDLEYAITGDNGCSKSYDPMKCEAEIMHSYAFDMKDGGRHHAVKDYENIEEILETLLNESKTAILESCSSTF